MKKFRDLGSREDRNILKLEIDKIMADSVMKKNGQLPTLKTLNSFSPRLFSFIIPVGERFTNPFFGLLNSFDRNAKVS
jgi:hypothetical protein